jgi:predicted O-methyltransferase YrrM
MAFCSGNLVVDRFITDEYENVLGMSSRFSATICGHVMRRQTELGIGGHFVEIGTFEGRFFIAMALGLAAGERALGIDSFDWPDAGLYDRFHANCVRQGLERDRYSALKANSLDLTPRQVKEVLDGPARFVHIDGNHAPQILLNDLALAEQMLHPKGMICLDDMLHPGYPQLVATVRDWLAQHPDMRVLCIIDRVTIIAATKFLICHANVVPLFDDDLMKTFAPQHYTLGGQFEGYVSVVLTPNPRLARID